MKPVILNRSTVILNARTVILNLFQDLSFLECFMECKNFVFARNARVVAFYRKMTGKTEYEHWGEVDGAKKGTGGKILRFRTP
jgi:hypothetical protein